LIVDYTFFVEVIDSAETVADSTPLTDSITLNLSTKYRNSAPFVVFDQGFVLACVTGSCPDVLDNT